MRISIQEGIILGHGALPEELELLASQGRITIYNHNRFFKNFIKIKDWSSLDYIQFMQKDYIPVFLSYYTAPQLTPHEWFELREHGMIFSDNSFTDKLAKGMTLEEMEKRKLLSLAGIGN